jgi:DNA-directed RNA polymerase subunit RPC12/RpoP
MKHKLDLLENAISSLREALLKFEEGSDKNLSAYKFAILHFSHFFELLFKHYVTLSHPLLIYKNPFSRNISRENTIGLWDAIQFLKNEGKEISQEFSSDLEWIKNLRNDIEHYKFELDVIDVRNVLGRLIRATDEFNEEHELIDVPSLIGGSHLSIYVTLGDEYKSKLATAKIKAKAESEDREGHLCSFCGELGVAARIGSELHCKLCTGVETLYECFLCGHEYREDEISVWNDENPPHVDYVCEYCQDHIMNKS